MGLIPLGYRFPWRLGRYARRDVVNAGPVHGNPNARESARHAVSEHDLQLPEHHVPILVPGVPVLNDPLGRQVQHPPQGNVIVERGLVLCDLPKLPVQTFNNVRRVYDFANLRRIFKEGV